MTTDAQHDEHVLAWGRYTACLAEFGTWGEYRRQRIRNELRGARWP